MADGNPRAGGGEEIELVAGPPDAILRVVGDLDISTCPALDAAIVELLDAGPASVTIDLEGVGFVGSTGLASLLRAQLLVTEVRGRFSLASPSRQVCELLAMTHLDARFDIQS